MKTPLSFIIAGIAQSPSVNATGEEAAANKALILESVAGPHAPLESERFVREWQSMTQTSDIASDCFGNSAQLFERRIALASFHAANIAGRSIRLQRQVLLGKPFGLTRRSNPLTKHLKRCRFSQPLQRPPGSDLPSSHYSGDFALVLFRRPFSNSSRWYKFLSDSAFSERSKIRPETGKKWGVRRLPVTIIASMGV